MLIEEQEILTLYLIINKLIGCKNREQKNNYLYRLHEKVRTKINIAADPAVAPLGGKLDLHKTKKQL